MSSDATEDFASRFGRALRESGFTLHRLRSALLDRGETIGLATLSYWRSGERRPGERGLEVVSAVEDILKVEAGELRRLVPERVRAARAPGYVFENPDIERAFDETSLALGGSWGDDDLRMLSRHVILTVEANRTYGAYASRIVFQAARSGVTGFPLIFVVFDGEGGPVSITNTLGLQVARHYVHPGGEAHGFLLEFDHPLSRGENTAIEYTVHTPIRTPIVAVPTDSRLRDAMVQVRFAPGAEPDWVEEIEGDPLNPRARPIISSDFSTATVARYDFGPGQIGVRWEYDD